MADQKLPVLNPEQITDFLEHFKKKCQLNSGQEPSNDERFLEKQLNDPDLQRLLDADHQGQLDVEVFRFLACKRANTGNISNFINFGKLSDKDVESATLKNKLRSMRLSQRIQNKRKEIQKRNELIEKDIELLKKLLAKKNTELDEDIKKTQQKVSLEIGKITRNIYSFNEKEKRIKSTMEQETKNLKAEETRAKDEMERKIEEMEKSFMKAKQATDKNILEMNENEVKMTKYYDMKFKKLKDEEAVIKKNIKNKQEMLARREEDFKKNIENLKRHEAEKTREFDAKLKRMNEVKSRVKENVDKNIKAKKTTLEKDQETFKKTIENMRQQEAERINELEAKLKEMNKEKAREEERIEKNIQAMQNTLAILEEEFKKCVENMRQQEAEKKCEVETKRQKINEMKVRNLKGIKNEQSMQITEAKKKRQIDEIRFQRVFEPREYEANRFKETVWEARHIKKENIEDTSEPQRKRLALNERDASGYYTSVRNTRRQTEEAFTKNRIKSHIVHPGGTIPERQDTISERHRRSQRTNRAPYSVSFHSNPTTTLR